MSLSLTREPYYRTCGGTDLTPETYWVVRVEGEVDYCFRFIEMHDVVGGLVCLIQDSVGHKTLYPDFFDRREISQVTDPEDIALAMLAIHA